MSVITRLIGTAGKALAESSTAADKRSQKPLERRFIQWLKNGNVYKPVGDVVIETVLEPAAYAVSCGMEGVFFERVSPKTDDTMVFEKSSMHKVVEEIDKFWNRKDAYDALGLMHNRGILLYGPPGTGKSICLQQVTEMMVGRGDIVLFTKSPSAMVEGLGALRQVEPDRRVVVAFEEADELARYDESTLLRLMDGDAKVGQVLFLATTNYIDRLPPRMLRPGRFDKKVYVATPTLEQRLQYLRTKAGKVATEEQIMSMARKTEGLSFGHLRELIAGVFAIGDPVDEVLSRLREVPVRESGHFTFNYEKSRVVESRPRNSVDRLLG